MNEINQNMWDEPVTITLNKDEALVLFEFVSRFNEGEVVQHFEDQAEQRAMWNLECLFESALVEPFWENYDEVIIMARNRLRDETGSWNFPIPPEAPPIVP